MMACRREPTVRRRGVRGAAADHHGVLELGAVRPLGRKSRIGTGASDHTRHAAGYNAGRVKRSAPPSGQ
jgi:hypothetical protein